jgi:anti-sigma factor RsiW
MAALSCADARDLFSARADDALSVEERAALDAHLATCAECVREWQRFAATVSLLRAAEPARAPAGFVDRVLAARPRPWYRRLARQLFVPWPVKLPVEAAAVVMLAGLAVLVFQRSPDLQQAARVPDAAVSARAPEAPAPARVGEYQEAPGPARERAAVAPPTAPAAPPTTTAPAPTTAPPPTAAPATTAEPAPGRRTEKSGLGVVRPEPQGNDAAAKSDVAPPAVSDARKDDAARAKAPAESPFQGYAPPAAAPPAGNVLGQAGVKEEQAAAARARQGVRDAQRPAAEGIVPTTPPPSGKAATRILASKEARAVTADAVLRLVAPDRAAAEREIRAVVARLGGVVTVPGPDALDVVVPPGTWEQFVRELGRVGTARVERAPADPSATIRLTLRLD